MRNNFFLLLIAVILLASCGSHKTLTEQPSGTTGASSAILQRDFVAKVINNAVSTENIVGNASVTLQMGSKDVTVPGSVHMRKDKVIRIQLFVPLLGSEIGRLEFTPDYVLVMDRFNRQYVKGDYNQLDFLRDNGISFYSLQALFWNQLTAPGRQSLSTADAELFSAVLDGNNAFVPVMLDKGKIKYQWNASRNDNSVTSAVVTYNGTSHGTSMLSWLYSDFTQVGKKRFPLTQSFSFQTFIEGKTRQVELKIKMNGVKNDANWDPVTEVSSKYKRVEAADVLSKLMSF